MILSEAAPSIIPATGGPTIVAGRFDQLFHGMVVSAPSAYALFKNVDATNEQIATSTICLEGDLDAVPSELPLYNAGYRVPWRSERIGAVVDHAPDASSISLYLGNIAAANPENIVRSVDRVLRQAIGHLSAFFALQNSQEEELYLRGVVPTSIAKMLEVNGFLKSGVHKLLRAQDELIVTAPFMAQGGLRTVASIAAMLAVTNIANNGYYMWMQPKALGDTAAIARLFADKTERHPVITSDQLY